MAQTYVGSDFTQVVPGATVRAKVLNSSGGTVSDGIVIIMGEADAGPSFAEETDLDANRFGPTSLGSVLAKYRSGNLVEAFRQASVPLADDNIVGAPSSIVFVKTNTGARASGNLLGYPSGNYGVLADRNVGQLGNLIQVSSEIATAETVPTTGLFTWVLNVGTLQIGSRVSGGARAQTANLIALRTPTQIVTDINGALTGVTAAGGALRTTVATGGPTVALGSVVGVTAVLTYSATWINTPVVGDTLYIPAGSVLQGAGSANVGSWVVTGVTTNTINVTKLRNATGTPGDPPTSPVVAVIAAAVTATPANDMQVYAPVSISVTAGVPVNGVGKSLELLELTGGTDLLSNCAYALSSTQVTWVSKTGSAKILTSATEYRARLNASRSLDSISETVDAGGEIGLIVGYTGTTATVTVTSTGITSTVSGGAGAVLPTINFSQFATISDLAVYINTQTGWTAAVGTTSAGQLPSSSLDRGTFNCGTEFGARAARIKVDAHRFFNAVSGQMTLVQLGATAARADSGLPAPTPITFLSGGAKGGTTAAAMAAAFTAIERVRGNFVVPLVSRDATADIADGLTEASSTYDIASVHSQLRSHLIKMELRQQAKNRQGFPSIKSTYALAKEAAANFSNFRGAMSFEDIRAGNGSSGLITQYQPWMASVIAAAGQAAAGYQALVKKFANISGALQAAGDWSDLDYDQVKDALEAGLLPIVRHQNGGWQFSSDQTTYSRDANFVYNSIQAVYTMDRISLNLRQELEDAFAGASSADVTAGSVVTFVQGRMAAYRSRKWITGSDDAVAGYKNISVTLNGPALEVNVEVKLAGAIYFIPINVTVSQVTQTATAQ